jgi:outer membrane protein assembly factor BamB
LHSGVIYGIDRESGETLWRVDRCKQTWSSTVIVDGVWIQGSCDEALRAYDLSDPTKEPPEMWSVSLPGCVESTPALWHGRIFVGTRSPGLMYAIGDG